MMGIVLRGGTILDRKGERSLDVSIDSDGKISETGKKLKGAELERFLKSMKAAYADHLHNLYE